jgi:hypothetical protein
MGFHRDGSISHRIDNHGARRARLLVARTPPGFLNATVYQAHTKPVKPGPGAGRRRPRGEVR